MLLTTSTTIVTILKMLPIHYFSMLTDLSACQNADEPINQMVKSVHLDYKFFNDQTYLFTQRSEEHSC